MRQPHASASPAAALAIVVACAVAVAAMFAASAAGDRPAAARRGDAAQRLACGAEQPPIAIARSSTADNPSAAVVLRVDRDPVTGERALSTLATQAQLGAVFGLAYDPRTRFVYAAAYHRRGAPFGPGGPGAIYRIDPSAGTTALVTRLPAGPDRHRLRFDDDQDAERYVGITSLGGLAVSDDGRTLFAANLFDGRIYRLDAATGAVLGSFGHGLAGASEPRETRLFAVALHGGRLFHGVSTGDAAASRTVHVFASRPDGSAATLEFRADVNGLGYRELTWASGEPVLTDVAFDADDNLVLAMRDVRMDRDLGYDGLAVRHQPATGLFLVQRRGEAWAASDASSLGDGIGGQGTERRGGAVGGVAAWRPWNRIVASAWSRAAQVDPGPAGHAAVVWLAPAGAENDVGWLGDPPARPEEAFAAAAPGDVVVLCGPGDVPPGVAATATSAPMQTQTAAVIAATATGAAAMETYAALSTTWARTATSLPPPATRVAAVQTAFAQTATAGSPGSGAAPPTPQAIGTATAAASAWRAVLERCAVEPGAAPGDPYFLTTHFARRHASERDPAVLAFAENGKHVEVAWQADVGAVFGLAVDQVQRQAYVGAYAKADTRLGPGGAGAVYRIDLDRAATSLFARLDGAPAPGDAASDDGRVGRSALGDVELSEDGRMLFVMNLADRLIYRFSVPDGALLGVFPTGGFSEWWSPDARPFGLGVWQGQLYHGVVDSDGSLLTGRKMTAAIYRSRPDGTALTPVSRFDLDYGPSGYYRKWGPWQVVGASPDRQPMLTDIEFRPDGTLVVGLRDRWGDVFDGASGPAGEGDILPSRRRGDGFEVITDLEHYADRIIHDESTWGTVARFPGLDWVVATAVDPIVAHTGGALWFDNASGAVLRRHTIHGLGGQSGSATSFGKINGLGDIEPLCLPPTVATATPTATAEATASPAPSPTPSESPSPAPTRTPVASATAGPRRVYVPLAHRLFCRPTGIPVDVVLVLDTSTSMRRTTQSGRSKLDAALGAARGFVGRLNLAPAPGVVGDRVAVVAFNDAAWIELPMSAAADAIAAAFDRLPHRMAEGTRLDLALAEASRAAQPDARRPGAASVIILLTDGLPNRVPTPAGGGRQEDTVLAAAAAARSAGSRIFTIGLGLPDDVLRDLLVRAASAPDDFYFAPDGDDLDGIYRQIAGRITGCE